MEYQPFNPTTIGSTYQNPDTYQASQGFSAPQTPNAGGNTVKKSSNKNRFAVIALIFAIVVIAVPLVAFIVYRYMLDLVQIYTALENAIYLILGLMVWGAVTLTALVLSIIGIIKSVKIKKNYGNYKNLISSIIAIVLSVLMLAFAVFSIIYLSDEGHKQEFSEGITSNLPISSYKRTIKNNQEYLNLGPFDEDYGKSAMVTFSLQQIAVKSEDDFIEYYTILEPSLGKMFQRANLLLPCIEDTSTDPWTYRKINNPEVVEFIKTKYDALLSECEMDTSDYLGTLDYYYRFAHSQNCNVEYVDQKVKEYLDYRYNEFANSGADEETINRAMEFLIRLFEGYEY